MADDNVIEGQPWRLRVAVASGDVKKATGWFASKSIKFHIKGGPGGDVDKDVKLDESGTTTIDYATPKVPDNQKSYKLTASASYTKEDNSVADVPLPDTCTVWPARLLVKIVDTADKAVNGVKVVAKQATKAEGNLTTDSGGNAKDRTGTAGLKLETQDSDFEVKVEAPHHIKEPAPDGTGLVKAPADPSKLREFKLKVFQTLTPKFIAITNYTGTVPPSDKSPIKTYINLTKPSPDPKPDELWGSTVEIEVGADPAKDGYEGVAGDKVYIEVRFNRESKRTTPAPALKDAGTVTKTAKSVGMFSTTPEIQKGEATLADNGSGKFRAKFKVDLGAAGGDTCEIRLSGAKDSFSATTTPLLKLVNWRRFYYQLTLPQGTTAPDLTRMTDALKEVFVEFIKYSDVQIDTDSGPGGSAIHWFDGAWLGESGKKFLNIGDYNKNHYHGKFVDDKTPVGVHVCCCHVQYDANSPSCAKDFLNLEADKTTTALLNDGTRVPGKNVYVGGGFFPKFLKDGTDAFVSGTWQKVGEPATTPLAATDIEVLLGDKLGWLAIKLPALAKDFVDAADTNKVKLAVSVKSALGPYLGEADGGKGWLQLIVVKQSTNVINDVMAHELGHTLQQVVKTAPPGFTEADHGRKYTANGHQGPHCADGMSTANYANGAGKSGSDYAGKFGGKKECTCIMFGENGANSTCTGKFCARCKPFLMAQELNTLH